MGAFQPTSARVVYTSSKPVNHCPVPSDKPSSRVCLHPESSTSPLNSCFGEAVSVLAKWRDDRDPRKKTRQLCCPNRKLTYLEHFALKERESTSKERSRCVVSGNQAFSCLLERLLFSSQGVHCESGCNLARALPHVRGQKVKARIHYSL